LAALLAQLKLPGLAHLILQALIKKARRIPPVPALPPGASRLLPACLPCHPQPGKRVLAAPLLCLAIQHTADLALL